MRATTTKIPHLLYEDLLKTPEVMHDFIYKWIRMMGMGEKPRNIYKNKEKSPVWLPSHPPVYKIGGRLFSGAKDPETSRTCPRWGWDPNL